MKKQMWLKIWQKTKHYSRHFHRSPKGFWSTFRYVLAILIALGLLFTFITLALVLPRLPDIDNIQNLMAAQSSVILDREGGVLYTIHGDENRKYVPLKAVAQHAINASLAIEDDQFYEHPGIDIGGILKAVCSELGVCKQRGGSTITQQFVKNAFLSPERTYPRKLKEIILALEIERKYSKDEILEMYLNRIPYGSSIFGVEVAAQTFFAKPAKDLTLAEGAILASIPKAPTYYSPYGSNRYVHINLPEEDILERDIRSEEELISYNPDFITKGLLGKTYRFGEGESQRDIYVKGRVDFVLSRMVELGYISEDEFKEALEEANSIEFEPYRESIVAPHFVMHVRELVEEKYGKDQIEKGGLRITTTLDGRLQAAADAAVEKYGKRNESNFGATNASLVALDPDNGQILAMVGSRDYWNDEIDGKVNVAMRPRLPGSSFKPIVYAAAFLQGYAPSTVLYNVKTKFGGWYEPENFDGKYSGPVTMREALGHSLNIPAVKTAALAGVPNILDLARKMGIQLNQPDNWYGLSLGLGAGEARLIDMVGAYSVFANGGYRVEPVAILKIEDRDGNILEQYEAPKKKDLILDPQVAYLVNDVLSDPEARPEGFWRDRLTLPGQINAAKTGTSNKEKNDVKYPFDVWTLGYTRRLAAGVWAGNAQGDHLSLKASGIDVAGPIWREFMVEATKEMPKENFERPEGIKWVKIAKRSGKLPSEHTPEEEVVTGVFTSFGVPREYDTSYRLVEVDKVSGKLATEFTPPGARENKAFFSHHSILPDNPNWENAVRQWAEENDQDEEPPTEYDDVHTADSMDTKPEIRITTPSSNSEVSPPAVGVWVNISSPAGVSKVDYYWDDKLVSTATTPPYKGNISLSQRIKKGSEHTVKAIVFDELYRSSQASVQVKIGEDNIPPRVSFSYPGQDAHLTAGTGMAAQVDAYDPNGDILKVIFYLDDKEKETVRSAPYQWQFTVPESLGEHSLKAIVYDHAKNESRATLNFISKNSSDHYSGKSRILNPQPNVAFDEGESILVKVYLAEAERSHLKELQILGRKESNIVPFNIATVQGESAQTYTFIWANPSAGRYELQMKITLSDNKVRFSGRVPVVVR